MTTKSTVFIGCDPGATGGIAVICGSAVSCTTMPRTDRALWDYLGTVISSPQNTVAGIEQVGGYIKGNPVPGSAMFEFGECYGALRMALVGHGLELVKGICRTKHARLIPPQEWQRGLGIDQRRKSESDSEWKRRLMWNAEKEFPKSDHPGLRLTLRTADAMLIAMYVRKLFNE